MTAALRTYGRWLLVPVIDDEDGTVTCWDVHPDVFDWSATDPVATGTTQRAAIADLRELLNHERTLRAFGLS